MKNILKAALSKMLKVIIALAIIVTQFTIIENVSAKEEVGRPSVHFVMEHFSGGITPTDSEGKPQSNTSLVSRGKGHGVIVNLVIDPDFTIGSAHGLHYDIQLPYFYYKEGVLVETLDEKDVPSDQKDENGKPLMGVGALVIEDKGADISNGEELYGQCTIEGSQMVLEAGNPLYVQVELFFYGDVPENAAATVSLGGGYEKYEDEDMDQHTIQFQTPPGSTSKAKYNLICSNLQWDTRITQVTPVNVLWDKYNYLVYRVEVENMSEEDGSYFNAFGFGLKVPTDEDESAYGLLKKEAMKWLYNPDGDPIENNSFTNQDRENDFVGVPGQGGVLIYDVTDIDEEELATWDLEKFSNTSQYEELPYVYTSNSMVSIRNDDAQVHRGQKKSYYFAIPMATNIPNYAISSLYTKLYTTIYFGTGNAYSWSKPTTVTGKFDAPQEGVTHNKYVEENGKQVKKKTVPIGSNVNYYLDDFENTGNIPVFNSYVVDTLPDKFDLSKVSIELNIHDGEAQPQLSDWFADPCEIQFEFLDSKTNETEYVSMGTFSPDTTATTDTIAVWSFNAKDALKDYLKAHKDLSFTGRLRIDFKERINVKEAMDGRIVVNGNVSSRDIFVNQLDTHFEKWLYVPPIETSEGELAKGGYSKTPKKAETTKATVETLSATPLIDVDAYQKKADDTYEYGDLVKVPINVANVGYRYKLGNDSVSDMIPGIFKSGNFLLDTNSTNQRGFIANQITFSKDLIEKSCTIDSITFHFSDGSSQVLSDVDVSTLAKDENGHYILDKTVWDDKILSSFEVKFDSFSSGIKLNNDVFISVDGSTNIVKPVQVEGSLETVYNDENADRKAISKATLDTQPANPLINVDVFKEEQYGDPVEVPLGLFDSGFRWRLANNSISEMTLAVMKSGDLLVSTGATSDGIKQYGFITETLILSKKLVEISQIDSVTLYMNDGTTAIKKLDDFTVDADGNYVLDELNGILSHFEVQFNQFDVYTTITDDVYIQAKGGPNVVQQLKVTGSFETQYNDATIEKKKTDTGTMNVGTIWLELSGYSFDDDDNKQSAINTAKNSVNNGKQTVFNSLTVPNKKENTGYDFTVINNSVSSIGDVDVKIDLASVGKKPSIGTVVKGFDTKEIKITSYEDVTKIKEIKLYDYDQNTATDTPAKVISFDDLKKEDGSLIIDEDMLKDLERLKTIVIVCNDYVGQKDLTDLKSMNIRITGTSDWFEDLNAVLTATPKHISLLNKIISLQNTLHVDKPKLDVHANISYYDNTPEQATADNANTDGNEMHLAVPYDRDFKYRVSVENKGVSILDDVDLIIDVPVNDKNATGGEENTGFHTTKVVINENLLKQFTELGYVAFYDIDELTTGIRFNYDQKTNKFVTDDGKELLIVDGKIEINEETLVDWGINNLGKVIVSGQKVKLKDATTENAWIDFYGFSDSLFGSTNRLTVNSNNYLDGIRDYPNELPPVNAVDHASAYISKMYFDTTVVAGYIEDKDNANRFEKISTSVEHMRLRYRNCSENAFTDNSELDVGYKAIGSFMVDFRQYLNVNRNYPVDPGEPTHDNYIWQEHQDWPWVYTQSLNTAANVNLTVDLPSNSFDAYYLKVDPRAKDYFNSITVVRKDGTKYVIDSSDWKDNSVEKNSEGKSFFRINLLTDDEQKRYETVTSNVDNDIYYKELKDYVVSNPITQVIVNLDINENEAANDTTAKNPDYGTWYVANDQTTKYMFEVTGRFYEEGTSVATVSTDMTVGGERGNSTTRTGHKAKERTISGKDTGANKTNWSYLNKYRHHDWIYSYYHSYCDEKDTLYDAADLNSTARVYVYRENNYVMKGVHDDPTVNQDTNVKYADYNEFAVSFYRGIQSTNNDGNNHDYLAGNGGWIYQDPFDWAGKHAHSDLVVLKDTLPVIRPDETTGYYGFLTQKIFISDQLYKYIDGIKLQKKQIDKSGTITTLPDAEKYITLSKSDLKASTTKSGYYEILLDYEENDAPETNEIVLGKDQFIESYEITLKNLPGNGDYARELTNDTQRVTVDAHGNEKNVDIFVGGEVYLVRGIHPVADALNKINSTTYKEVTREPDEKETTKLNESNEDGYMQGYRLPFQGGFDITSMNNRDIYDYETTGAGKNLNPTNAPYEVKIWNRTDTDQDTGRSSTIKTATVTNTMHSGYRLKHINIPKEFIDGDWFNVTKLTLNYNGRSVNLSLADLKKNEGGYFTLDSSNTNYVFDVNKYIRDNVSEFATYTVENTTDTYVKEQVTSFVIVFEAADIDLKDDNTVLKGGQYLSPDKTNKPAFTYDGVYVDRNTTDVASNKWTEDSRPTVINDRFDYWSGDQLVNTVNVSFAASNLNAEAYQGNLSGTDTDDYYRIQNLVGTMIVNMTRGTLIDGKNSFAYDRDKKESTTEQLAVNSGHLLPDDYIEYHLTVGAHADSKLPIYHPDVRFTVPKGQRIVGWKIEDPFNQTTTKISSDDITATVNDGTSDITLVKDKMYSLTKVDDEYVKTNYKELNISVGDLNKTDEFNMVQPGDKLKITVITQLTDETSQIESVKVEEAKFEAAARPKHTYSQYMVHHETGGAGTGYCTQVNAYHSHDGINYYRYDKDFYRVNGNPYVGKTYTSEVRSGVQFFAKQNLGIEYTYDDPVYHFDRQKMTIKTYGAGNTQVINHLQHTLETATFTMTFLSESNGKLYKGFDLTEKPEFKYPENVTGTKPIKVEYCYFDEKDTLEEGVYVKTTSQNETWIEEKDIVFADELSEDDKAAGKCLARDAVKVRWTYYDIPAWGNDGNTIVFASPTSPFTFKGEGRYRDIRTDAQKQTTRYAERYTMNLNADYVFVHKHSEDVDNTIDDETNTVEFEESFEFTGTGSTTKAIARERPILTLHTQIFDSEDKASLTYDASKEQTTGYRPNDTVWFKTTVINHALTEAQADTGVQGALLDPIIYDKIPEYIETSGLDRNDITVLWYDKDGKLKDTVPQYEIKKRTVSDVEDFGGDFITTKPDTDGSSMNDGHAFTDIYSGTNTQSTPINYNLYSIEFDKGTRLEIGEKIEVHYSAKIREEKLPLSYSTRDGKTFVDYYPKMGEYYQRRVGYYYGYYGKSFPYIGLIDHNPSEYYGSSERFANENVMMDMNYLQHDVGLSGTRNPNIDKYEYLADSYVYMPGTSNDGTGVDDNYGGSNGYLKDFDMCVTSYQQQTRYVPTLTPANLDQLPVSEQYVNPANNRSRDYYSRILSRRNRSYDWQDVEKHEDVVIWTQARTHLQTAWLATSSQMYTHTNNYLSNTEYLSTAYHGPTDPHYDYYSDSSQNWSDEISRMKLYNDDSITALEYDQNYMSRLGAYNYGDWDLTSGIEFIYVLPRGVEPRLDEDGNLDLSEMKGYSLSGGNSKSPSWDNIPSEAINVSVLQRPGEDNGYLSPNVMQDPLISTYLNRSKHDYANESKKYYTSEDGTPWVLKVTVNQSLNKWFNRGSKFGYMMLVDIPTHVYKTNPSEYWYDEVMARPLDVDHQDSLYYQIYDTTSYWGNNLPRSSNFLSTQYGGMDWLWNSYLYDWSMGNDSARYFVNGSPNTPYINGMNVSNREVSAQNTVEDAGGRESFSSGHRQTYASTGTRAHMRKPVIRTWTTVGNSNITGKDLSQYYVNTVGTYSKLHIHVENKYYLNGSLPNGIWHNQNWYKQVYQTYATEGGNMGTLYYPVVTDILPAGTVPRDENGELFTPDNEENLKKVLNWSISDKDGGALSDEKALYDAIVEYIELESEEGEGKVEGRYKVTFVPKSTNVRDEQKAKITSTDTRVFSFDFFTKESPSKTTKTGTNTELLYQYQKNHTYVSSQLDNFKFLTDANMANNPFGVGSLWRNFWTAYGGDDLGYTDDRRDSIYAEHRHTWYDYGNREHWHKGGWLPNSIGMQGSTLIPNGYHVIDATEDGGIKVYSEDNNMQLEDYNSIRWELTLNDKDFNRNGDNATIDAGVTSLDTGVHTSNRIRVKHAGIENQSYVSTKPIEKDENNLGGRSPEGYDKKIYTHYPLDGTAVQYGDNLYYNVNVSNHSDSTTDYHRKGDILHAKVHVTIVLPSIVSYRSQDDDRFYVIYTDGQGQKQKATFKDLTESGYIIELIEHEFNDDGTETVVFDIITPGERTKDNITYQDFIEGYKLPGFLGSGDSFVFGIKTVIDHGGANDTLLSDEKVWDDNYKADTYVSLHDTKGSYLEEMYPNSGFEELDDQDISEVKYIRETKDNLDEGIDLDLDKETDIYASDVTSRVTVLKPESVVRVDTSISRVQISNPDAEVVVAEDPTIKGATKMTIYLDEVINKEAAVPEFIVDYRVPFHGKSEGSVEEATINDNDVYPYIYAIGTGIWEVPESAGTEEYRKELEKRLKVHVYALVSEDQPAADDVSYTTPGTEKDENWIELTDIAGVDIHTNQIIDLSQDHADIRNKIYQLRYVITADVDRENGIEETREYLVPQGFRLDIDADPNREGNQEMDDVDPKHNNLEQLPDSVVSDIEFDTNGNINDVTKTGNAAFVVLTVTHTKDENQHVNHFAKAWARYDDEQIGALSERSRAGYYISREIPTLQIDLSVNYFKRQSRTNDDGQKEYYYSWVPNFVIDNSSSMLRYSTSLTNLSQEKITDIGSLNGDADNSTNPQIATVLPYVQDISNIKDNSSSNLYNYKFYKYVDYAGDDSKTESISKGYESKDRLNSSDSTWTWHVEDEKGTVIENSSVKNVNLRMYDKAVDLTNLQRRVMTWDFQGTLQPGQKIVIDYMVPISTKDNGIVSSSLLECKAYGFKEGTFNPYVPVSDNANETYAIEVDTRDINENGLKKSEVTLVKSLGGLSFASNKTFTRTKVSHSEYGSGLTASGNGNTRPSIVPEGSDYSFTTTVLNPDSMDNDNGYNHPIIYDVLPFVGDKTIISDTPRNTKWRGYIYLDSIKVEKQYGTISGVKTEELEDGKTTHVWVGPFKKENGKITALEISDLPDFEQTRDKEFYKSIYGESDLAIAEKQKYFVRLSELLALKTSDPELYEELQRSVQAIYAEPISDFVLKGATKFTVSYNMKAPLNLPMYPEYVTEDDADLKKKVAEYSGWNTFAAQSEDEPTTESPQAGVYLDAPADKGYIGHYVWLDESYNAQFTDEGDYFKRDKDGRWLFNKATKDLDYDGELDDPGINGVKVELLSEKGYPVNRLGEPVVEVGGKYLIIDENTGKIALSTTGQPTYTIYGPEYYITEKDAYGNSGYFIISNITPGKYKLRYTFPEGKYDEHSITTRTLGTTGTVTGVDVYRQGDHLPDLGDKGVGDSPTDYKEVNGLVVQTKEAIQIDAIGKDPSTYKAYDEKMTSYDVGIARAYIYGGYAWFDEREDPNNEGNTISDGIMDDDEERLPNVNIQFYEVDEDGTRKVTYDGDGKIAKVTTDKDGYFEISLYPYKNYVAIADTSQLHDRVYRPTPFTLTRNPLERDDDNDLELDNDKKNVSFIFTSGPVIDNATGKPIMTDKGSHGKFVKLGFGFVEAGKGFIGKNVYYDQNYDGIRNQYTNADGNIASEPGVDGVHLILEEYYFDTADNTWKYLEGQDRVLQSAGGSYIFQNVRTTYTSDDDQKYLAGYRVKLDMSTVPEGYTPTKYYMGNGVMDSDLPVNSNEQYRYLSEILVIANDVTDNPIGDNILEVNGKKYDTSDGLMILDNDAGFTTMDKAVISGKVWDDKNYDGQQDKYQNADGDLVDEEGIEGIELQLVPYYYNDKTWVALKDVSDEYKPTVTTDADGVYKFDSVPSYITIDNKDYIVSYKIKVISDIAEKEYAVSRYHIGNQATDSDLIKETMLLNESNDYIIVAKKIAETNDIATINKEYGNEKLGNHTMLIHNQLGYFDKNRVINFSNYDAGLKLFDKNNILGNVWDDKDYDGILDESEVGIPQVELKLDRYYLDVKTNTWVKDTGFNNQNVQTNDQGDYKFENLDTYVYIDGQYYLAGYKVSIVSEPDRSVYAITLYRQDTEGRNSDLRKDLFLNESNEYIIIADETKLLKNNPYIVRYQDKEYDLIESKEMKDYDAGYIKYPMSKITGNVFEDLDYDGLLNNEDGFLEGLKEAIKDNNISITATAYYYDEGWKLYHPTENTNQTYSTEVTSVDNDGHYEIEVPTQIHIDGVSKLAGYKLEVNIVPEGYRMTKYLKNKGIEDSSLVKTDGKYILTKTASKAGYLGKLQEEYKGIIVAANPANKETLKDNVNVQEGYDIARGRTLKDYNVGYTEIQTSAIEGISFKDINYNGIYEQKTDELIPNAKIGIKRYYYDNGKWILDNEPQIDPITGEESEYYRTLTTDGKGYYKFDNLPTYKQMSEDDKDIRLYGYTVWYLGGVDNLAVTKYQVNKGINDSALKVEIDQVIKQDDKIPEMKNGYTIVAEKVDDINDESLSYVVEGYDIADGRTRENYNLGFTNYQEGVIEGNAFIEEDYNGIFDDHDKGLEDIEVGIKRYIYNSNTKEWSLAQDEDQEYFATTKTDDKGHYSFNDLGTYTNIDGVKYLYGYKVWLIKGLEEIPVTKYQTNKGVNDNALLVETNQVVKKDETIPEMKDGYIVVADKPEDLTNIDPFYIIDGYDIISTKRRDNYNIGYVPYQTGSIEGIAFDDLDYDGIFTEADKALKDVQIGLKCYYYDTDDKKWHEIGAMPIDDESNQEQYMAITNTNENGYYIFDELPSFIQLSETKKCLYGYELWMLSEDGDRMITKYQMNNGEKDSALIATNHQVLKKDKLLPEVKDGYIIIGDNIQGQTDINKQYVLEGYDTVKGKHHIEYNMGFVPKETYHIQGNIWEDLNDDGINNDNQNMKDIEVTLERYYLLNGKWHMMDDKITMKTDDNGNYIFDNLEIYGTIDEQDVVYGYKVKIEKIPEGYDVAKYQVNDHENDSDMNVETGYLEDNGSLIVLADKTDETTSAIYDKDGYNISHGHSQEDLDGGLVPYGSGMLQGIVFEDLNKNGVFDEDEEIVEGAVVYLDYLVEPEDRHPLDVGRSVTITFAKQVDKNMVYESGTYENFKGMKVITDAEGTFTFNNLPIVDENNNAYQYRLRMYKPDGTEFTGVYPFNGESLDKKNIYGGRVTKEMDSPTNEGITKDILLAQKKGKDNYYNLEWEVEGKEYKQLYLGYCREDEVDISIKNTRPKTSDSSQPEIFSTMMIISGIYITYQMFAYKRRRKEAE